MYGLILWFRFKVCISSFFTLRSVVSFQELWWWWSRSWYGLGRWDPERRDHMTHTVINEGDIWIILNEVNKKRILYKSYIMQSLLFNEGKCPINSTHWFWSSRTNMMELVPQENTISQSLILSIEIKFQHFHWASYFKDKILSVLPHIGNKIFCYQFFYFLFLTCLFLWLRNFPASWTW